jgi:hypothetical protein
MIMKKQHFIIINKYMIKTTMDIKSTTSSSSKATVHQKYLANDVGPVKVTTCGGTSMEGFTYIPPPT